VEFFQLFDVDNISGSSHSDLENKYQMPKKTARTMNPGAKVFVPLNPAAMEFIPRPSTGEHSPSRPETPTPRSATLFASNLSPNINADKEQKQYKPARRGEKWKKRKYFAHRPPSFTIPESHYNTFNNLSMDLSNVHRFDGFQYATESQSWNEQSARPYPANGMPYNQQVPALHLIPPNAYYPPTSLMWNAPAPQPLVEGVIPFTSAPILRDNLPAGPVQATNLQSQRYHEWNHTDIITSAQWRHQIPIAPTQPKGMNFPTGLALSTGRLTIHSIASGVSRAALGRRLADLDMLQLAGYPINRNNLKMNVKGLKGHLSNTLFQNGVGGTGSLPEMASGYAQRIGEFELMAAKDLEAEVKKTAGM
jgi:hypothetical protein